MHKRTATPKTPQPRRTAISSNDRPASISGNNASPSSDVQTLRARGRSARQFGQVDANSADDVLGRLAPATKRRRSAHFATPAQHGAPQPQSLGSHARLGVEPRRSSRADELMSQRAQRRQRVRWGLPRIFSWLVPRMMGVQRASRLATGDARPPIAREHSKPNSLPARVEQLLAAGSPRSIHAPPPKKASDRRLSRRRLCGVMRRRLGAS